MIFFHYWLNIPIDRTYIFEYFWRIMLSVLSILDSFIVFNIIFASVLTRCWMTMKNTSVNFRIFHSIGSANNQWKPEWIKPLFHMSLIICQFPLSYTLTCLFFLLLIDQVYNASKLIDYCHGFLLKNIYSLLTYDDCVKRLLFAKNIPNNDVLTGLLQALQNRVKQRRGARKIKS